MKSPNKKKTQKKESKKSGETMENMTMKSLVWRRRVRNIYTYTTDKKRKRITLGREFLRVTNLSQKFYLRVRNLSVVYVC